VLKCLPACLPAPSSVPQFPPIHCAIFYLHFSLVVCLTISCLLNPFCARLLFAFTTPAALASAFACCSCFCCCPAAECFLLCFCHAFAFFYLHFCFIFLMSCNFCFICRRHACTNNNSNKINNKEKGTKWCLCLLLEVWKALLIFKWLYPCHNPIAPDVSVSQCELQPAVMGQGHTVCIFFITHATWNQTILIAFQSESTYTQRRHFLMVFFMRVLVNEVFS